MCHLFQNAIFSAICIGHDICISADICILTVLFLNCVVYIHIERGMHKHHGTLIPLIQLRRRCSHSRCRVYTPFVPKLAFLQSLYFKHTIRRTSTNRHAHLLYCNCDMYICNALYILQLRYVYRHVYRHAYRHRTLYIATAICISAPHFIYCMYICNALYILQLLYRHCTLLYCKCDMYIGTALYIFIYCNCDMYIGNATAISKSAPHLIYN